MFEIIRNRFVVKYVAIHKLLNKVYAYSLKINELIQSSQAGVYFFQLNSC